MLYIVVLYKLCSDLDDDCEREEKDVVNYIEIIGMNKFSYEGFRLLYLFYG